MPFSIFFTGDPGVRFEPVDLDEIFYFFDCLHAGRSLLYSHAFCLFKFFLILYYIINKNDKKG